MNSAYSLGRYPESPEALRWRIDLYWWVLYKNREIPAGADRMTIDKSLRVKRGATRNRSVLTRVERIARLTEVDAWKEGGCPSVCRRFVPPQSTMKKKKKKKEEEGAEVAAAGAAGLQLHRPLVQKMCSGKAAAAKPAGGKK